MTETRVGFKIEKTSPDFFYDAVRSLPSEPVTPNGNLVQWHLDFSLFGFGVIPDSLLTVHVDSAGNVVDAEAQFPDNEYLAFGQIQGTKYENIVLTHQAVKCATDSRLETAPFNSFMNARKRHLESLRRLGYELTNGLYEIKMAERESRGRGIKSFTYHPLLKATFNDEDLGGLEVEIGASWGPPKPFDKVARRTYIALMRRYDQIFAELRKQHS